MFNIFIVDKTSLPGSEGEDDETRQKKIKYYIETHFKKKVPVNFLSHSQISY